MILLPQGVFSLHGPTGIPLAWQAAEYASNARHAAMCPAPAQTTLMHIRA